MKLDRLTPEQKATLPQIRDEWLAIGLSCEPLDLARAKQAACTTYRCAGLDAPSLFFVADSPFSAAIMSHILEQCMRLPHVRKGVIEQVYTRIIADVMAQVHVQVEGDVMAQVHAETWAQVGAQVKEEVWAQVRAQGRAPNRQEVWAQVRAQNRQEVWTQVWAQIAEHVRQEVWPQVGEQFRNEIMEKVGEEIWAQVGQQLRREVMEEVWAQVGEQFRNELREQIWGSHDAAWLSYYAAVRTFGLVNETECISGLFEMARAGGWYTPYNDAIIVQHRHSEIHMRDRRLHNETGPAVLYRDGFSVWSINGVRVDEQVVLRPQSQTIEQMAAEKSEEVRRIRIDRFGWPRYIAETDAECRESRRNAVDGTTEALIRLGDGSQRLLCVCRSTGRVFAIGVPREVDSCEQAQRFMSGGSHFGDRLNVLGAS